MRGMELRRSRRCAAFTLFEMLVTIGIIAVVASAIIPMLGDERQLRIQAAAGLLESDIEFLQVHAMSRPDEPLVLRMAADWSGWWIAGMADRDTPVLRPDGSPYLVTLGIGRARSAAGVQLFGAGLEGGRDIRFSSLGALADPASPPMVLLDIGSVASVLHVAPFTGRVTGSVAADDIAELRSMRDGKDG